MILITHLKEQLWKENLLFKSHPCPHLIILGFQVRLTVSRSQSERAIMSPYSDDLSCCPSCSFWIGRPIWIQLVVLGTEGTDEEDDIILNNSLPVPFGYSLRGGQLEIQAPKTSYVLWSVSIPRCAVISTSSSLHLLSRR
jgi:hypothetical protein